MEKETTQTPAVPNTDFQLNPEGEDQWQLFRTAVDWSDSFELFFLFSSSPPLMQSLFERLKSTLDFDNKPVLSIKPDSSDNLILSLLSQLFPEDDAQRGLKTLVWLDLTSLFSKDDILLLKQFLSRLNERREKLRRRFALPCIILLPETMLQEMPFLVPDLWSVRNPTYTFDLVKHTFYKPADTNQNTEPTYQKSDSLLSKKGIELTLKEWRRLVNKDLNADALDVVYPLIWNSIYSLSSDALSELQHWLISFPKDVQLRIVQQENLHDSLGIIWRRQGKLETALTEFTQALELAQKDVEDAEDKENYDIYKQRSLYVFYTRVADVQADLGRYDEALQNQQQALKIARELQTRSNNSPESIQDTYYSLLRIADIQKSLGDTQEALENHQEALSLAKQVQQLFGDTATTLRNISLAQGLIADIQHQQGQQQAALENYQQALLLQNQIREITGDTPKVLRDTSVALNKVASVEQSLGQVNDALEKYQQSLALRHQIQQIIGDNPETLRDISVSLWKLANIFEKSGDKTQAISHFEQALEYRQKALDLSDYKDDLAKDCKAIEDYLKRLTAEM